MYIPIVKKMANKNGVLIERTLPVDGDVVANVGDKVEPFSKLGMTKVSYGSLPLGHGFRFAKGKNTDSYFYTGNLVGRSGGKKILAPFDGTVVEQDGSYIFKQELREYWLLAGVTGEVVGVVEKKSIMIKTQVVDISFAACTGNSKEGELVVFPNPAEILEMQYLEKFSKDSFGKIIYVGDYISQELAARAVALGAAGLIAGSVDRSAMTVAKRSDMFLGSISGFGHIPTPKFIFDVLKEVSNRYVFLQGNMSVLRIPIPEEFDQVLLKGSDYTGRLRMVKKGLLVQVFDYPYFGWVGKVEKIEEDGLTVVLDEGGESVKVKIPNVLALE